MFSVVFLRAYRKPRELTWVSGCVLLFLTLGFGFSGYLLPWNTLAFFATKVGTEIVGRVPLVGHWLLVFLRGGEEVSGATLGRFFAFHVAILPGVTTLVVAIHLALIQRQGISVPPGMESAMHVLSYLRKHDPEAAQVWSKEASAPAQLREMRFFPNFFLRELMAWYVALGVLGVLAALAPWELGSKADPFAPAPAGIKPEWYFLFMFQTLKLLPAQIWFVDGEVLGILAFGAAGLLWTLLPFLDRSQEGRPQRWITGAGVFVLAYFLPLSSPKVNGAIQEAFKLLQWYARNHTLACVVPALFIAGFFCCRIMRFCDELTARSRRNPAPGHCLSTRFGNKVTFAHVLTS